MARRGPGVTKMFSRITPPQSKACAHCGQPTGQTGKHWLASRFTGFDPLRTSAASRAPETRSGRDSQKIDPSRFKPAAS